jgi:hypothetical protein
MVSLDNEEGTDGVSVSVSRHIVHGSGSVSVRDWGQYKDCRFILVSREPICLILEGSMAQQLYFIFRPRSLFC